MTVTYTKQVSRCGECPNCSPADGGDPWPTWWCNEAYKRTDRDTIPTWCPLRPAPGEEWTRVEDALPVVPKAERGALNTALRGLQGEIDRLQAEVEAHSRTIRALHEELESKGSRLHAEVEALRVDAERYRVLRGVWFAMAVMNDINTEPGAPFIASGWPATLNRLTPRSTQHGRGKHGR